MIRTVLATVATAAMLTSSTLLASPALADTQVIDLNETDTVPVHSEQLLIGSHTTGLGLASGRWTYSSVTLTTGGSVEAMTFGGGFAAGTGLTAGIYTTAAVGSGGFVGNRIAGGATRASEDTDELRIAFASPVTLSAGTRYYLAAQAISTATDTPWIGHRSQSADYGYQNDDGTWTVNGRRSLNVSISTREVPYLTPPPAARSRAAGTPTTSR